MANSGLPKVEGGRRDAHQDDRFNATLVDGARSARRTPSDHGERQARFIHPSVEIVTGNVVRDGLPNRIERNDCHIPLVAPGAVPILVKLNLTGFEIPDGDGLV